MKSFTHPETRDYVLGASERDTMRQMSQHEMSLYYVRNVCPFCCAPAVDMLRGPRGGLSANVECVNCEARLNVVTGIPRGVMWIPFGQVIRDPKPDFEPHPLSAPQ